MVIVTTAVYWGLNSPLQPTTQVGFTGPLNLPAPGRRQSVYFDLIVFARTCVFSKQSLPSLLCGPAQPHHRKGGSPRVAPLLPKLRGHFAEFLNHSSPDRLSILYLTTCVGFGYGPHTHSLEAFLGSIGSSTSPHTVGTHHVSPSQPYWGSTGFPWPAGYTLTPQSNQWLDYLPASPHRLATTRY